MAKKKTTQKTSAAAATEATKKKSESVRVGIEDSSAKKRAESNGLRLSRQDTDDSNGTVSSLATSLGAFQDSDAIIKHLERELELMTREDFERSMQDMETANKELKSSNEELLSMNQELLSANEELETSKRELQSAVVKIAKSKNDLENLFRSTRIATIFLDDDWKIRSFTPASVEIYSITDTDIGQPLAGLMPLSHDIPPLPTVCELIVDEPIEDTIRTHDGTSYIRRVLPYLSDTGETDGIVVTFTDVSELCESEERLQRALVAASMDAFEIDLKTGLAKRKGSLLESLGLEPAGTLEELKNRIEVKDRLEFEATISACTPEEPHYLCTYRITVEGKGNVWLCDDAEMIYDQHGRPSLLVGTRRDVTKTKQTELALIASERQMRTIADALPPLIAFVDVQGRYRFANAAYENHFGLAAESIIGHRIVDVVGREAYASIAPHLNKALAGEALSYELELANLVNNKTEFKQVTYVPEINESGEVLGCHVLAVDVTEQKHWSVEIAKRESHLRRVIDNMLGFVGVLGVDGTLLEANQTALAVGGVSREEVIGKKFWDCYWWNYDHEISQQLQEAIAAAATGETVRYDVVVRMAGDTRITIDFMLVPVRDETGNITRLIVSGMDISDRKRAEALADATLNHLNLALEAGQLVTWDWNIASDSISWSDQLYELFGISPNELDGSLDDFTHLVHPDDQGHVGVQIKKVLAGKSDSFEIECRILRPSDGRMIWTLGRASVKRDAEGNPLMLTGVASDITERKNLEIKLADAKTQLDISLEAGGMAPWSWDVENDAAVTNPMLNRMFGFHETETPALSDFIQRIDESARSRVLDAIKRATKLGENYDVEYPIHLPSGEIRHVRARGQTRHGEKGKLEDFFGVIADITTSKQWEIELANREAHLRRVINNQLGLVGVIGRDGKLLEVDDRSMEIAGLTRGDVIGKPFAQCGWWTYENAVADLTRDAVKRAFTGERVRYDVGLFSKCGTPLMIDFMIAPVLDGEGNVEFLIYSGVDISERVAIERRVKANEERLSMALNAAKMAAWEWRKDESYWTPQLYRLMGVPPDERASSETFFQHIHPDDVDLLKKKWEKTTQGDQSFDHEFRIIRPDGEIRWVVGVGEVERDEIGNVKRVYGLNWDSTGEHFAADALRASEQRAQSASESKSEFLANMSHEIRTPMSAIIGYADILARHLKDPDDLNCVSIIRNNGKFLLAIINDILDISKIEAGKIELVPKPFRMDRLLADVRSLMNVRAAEKLIEFSVELDGQIPQQINSDSKRLKQILINLISNAIKFTETGSVQLVVRFLPSVPKGMPNTREPHLQFDIIDTGIGISDQQQQRLFQPFTQADASVDRKFGGTGLGLAISQRLAGMLGGRITVESKSGKGSIFSLAIAINTLKNVSLIDNNSLDAAAPAIQKTQANKSRLAGHILVVDDRREIRFIAQHFIEDAGGSVATGKNGQDAIDAIEKAAQDGNPFDLLVIDMQMPVLDGYEATRRLRAAGFDKPIIALTAHAMEGDREECLKAGCTDYLPKPLDGPRFTQMLHSYLVKKSKTAEPASSKSRKILIIDDSQQAADAVSTLLSFNGHEVQTANSGNAGIELAKSFEPDIVLLDLRLPDMTGFDVLEKLRKHPALASTRFIATTGRDHVSHPAEAGFHHHIVKPINVGALEEWLQVIQS